MYVPKQTGHHNKEKEFEDGGKRTGGTRKWEQTACMVNPHRVKASFGALNYLCT